MTKDTFKHIAILFPILLLLFMDQSCVEEHPKALENTIISLVPMSLEISSDKVDFSTPESGQQYLRVNSNNIGWAFTNIPDWIVVSPLSGSGASEVSVQVSRNPRAVNRVGLISFCSDGGSWNYNKGITISQYRAPYVISLPVDNVQVDGGGGSITVKIDSNTDTWSIVIPSSMDWCRAIKTEDGLVVTAYANTGNLPRSGKIELHTDDVSAYLTVTQRPAGVNVTTDRVDFPVEGGIRTIPLTIEASWTVECAYSWIDIKTQSGNAGYVSIPMEATPNLSTTSRDGFIYIVISADNKIEIPVHQDCIEFSVDRDTISFPSGGSTERLEIHSNVNWTIPDSILGRYGWLTVDPLSGNGSTTVLVKANPNLSINNRSFSLPIYLMSGGSGTGRNIGLKEIEIEQEGRQFGADSTAIYFSSKAGRTFFNIKSDGIWLASTSYSWITISPEYGMESGQVLVSVTENTSDTTRVGYIRIVTAGQQESIPVYQSGRYIRVSSDALMFGSLKDSTEISLTTNGYWTAVTDQSWITLSATEGDGNCQILITTQDNPSSSSREGNIIVTREDMNPVIITVNQNGRYLSVSTSLIEFFPEGGTSEPIIVQTDGKFDITTDADWITINKETESQFTLTVSENNGTNSRTGDVTIGLTDLLNDTLVRVITVIQDFNKKSLQVVTFPEEYVNDDSIIVSGQILNPENVASEFECGFYIFQKKGNDTILVYEKQSDNYKDGLFSANGIIYDGGNYFYCAVYIDSDTVIYGNLLPLDIVDIVQIKASLNVPHLDLLWGIDWETEFMYDWDESSANFGPIGYSQPELLKGTIYSVDKTNGKRFSSFFKIFDADGGRVSLTVGSSYDMLFYNFGTEWISFYQSEDYGIYTASSRKSDGVFYEQPDELFGNILTGIDLDSNPSNYEKEYDVDDNPVYVLKKNVSLRPYTFIYMCQVVLLNNDDGNGNRVTGAKGLTVSGLAQSVDLFTRETSENAVSISVEDIKPMQNHNDVQIDYSMVDNADIMAARFVTFGLPQKNTLEDNYMGIGLTLRNGQTYAVTRNITDQMHQKPTGGVITVYIDADDIPVELYQTPHATPEYVDLGLSVNWATFNVGATAPEEYGDYYAWGETEPYYEPGYAQSDLPVWKSNKTGGYTWSSYTYCYGSATTLSKYCFKSNYGYNSYTDDKEILDLEDDVAHAKWGGNWYMPTDNEADELRLNCTWTWTNLNGVNGYILRSKIDGFTDRSIFLPAAGHRSETQLYNVGTVVSLWCGRIGDGEPDAAYRLYYDPSSHDPDGHNIGYYDRYRGLPIRPVCPSSTYSPLRVALIELNYYEISLTADDEPIQITAIPINSKREVISADVEWSSSDETVAVVSNDGSVTAIGAGKCTITASVGDVESTCLVTVPGSAVGYENGYEYVDLGLSVKWASYNVGASKPEEYGDYYAWGEIEPYYEVGYAQSESPIWKSGKSNGYDWQSYKYGYDLHDLTKYCTESNWDEYSEFIDGKSVLDLEDDVAHVKWGGSWRMPTHDELGELQYNCTWLWTNQNGVDGCQVTSNKIGYEGRSIFLPAVGSRGGINRNNFGVDGHYWSNSTNMSDPGYAWGLSFDSECPGTPDDPRVSGFAVRPVCP